MNWLADVNDVINPRANGANVISAAQVFDTVYALTGGGPQGRTDLIAHRIYAEAFGAAAVGRAAVMAAVLFVLLVGVTIVQHLYFKPLRTHEPTKLDAV